jgi:hypothetical protein
VSDIAPGDLSQTGNPVVPPKCNAGDPTCSDDPGTPTHTDPPKTCTTTVTNTTADNVKVFFLVDVSGSNQTGDDKNGNSPTDPSVLEVIGHKNGKDILGGCMDDSSSSVTCKKWRKGVLDKFFATYLPKPSFSFEVATFQGDSASSLIVDNNNKTLFSRDMSAVNDSVPAFLKVKDSGGTPYQAVLNMAESAISYDLGKLSAADKAVQKYVVVMITDGMPSDDNFNQMNSDKTVNTAANTAALKDAVAHVVNIAPGQVTFNTVLYYPTGHEYKNAEDYLQAMAVSGSGIFSKADSSVIPFQIDSKITVSTGVISGTCPRPPDVPQT